MIEQFDPPFLPYTRLARPRMRGTAYLYWIDPSQVVSKGLGGDGAQFLVTRVDGWELEVQDRGDDHHPFFFGPVMFDKGSRQRRWRPVVMLHTGPNGLLNPDWSVHRVDTAGDLPSAVVFQQMLPRLKELTAWSWSRIGEEQLRQIARDRKYVEHGGAWRT